MTNKPSNPKDRLGIAKIPSSCVSQLVLMEVGVAMFEGQSRYGGHNYRAVGVKAGVYYDAAQRHLNSWWEGQDIDPASGLSHITKAITSLIVLRDGMIMGMWEDDRPPRIKDLDKFMAELTVKVEEIIKNNSHINPIHYTEKGKTQNEADQ